MSKLSKDFRDETNKSFRESDYVTRKVLARGLIVVGVISVLSLVGGTYAKRYRVNQDRITFKQSLTYNEGVIDDLAKYKYEMTQAKDDIEKKAIAELVRDRFANYDDSKIENQSLKQFLKDCRNGSY